jgi:hypothetical protein
MDESKITTETPKEYLRKESPAVLASFPSLKRGRQELKVRVIQYSKSGPLLDIREFLTTPETRFTKKGITISWDQLLVLMNTLDQIQAHMNPDYSPE